MKTNRAILLFAVTMIAVVTLALHGCAASLGRDIGAKIDAAKPDQTILPAQVATIKPGTSVKVIFKDGSYLSGKYSGLDRISTEQYAAIYSQAREQKPEGISLPALGDSINIRLFPEKTKEPETSLEGAFEGFEHDHILTKLKGTIGLSEVHLTMVTKITDSRGYSISGETMQRLILAGKTPVLSAIVVEGKAGKTLDAMDSVSRIEIPVKKHGALSGFLIGVAIDAAVLFLPDLLGF